MVEGAAIRQCLPQTAQGHKEDREASHPCGAALIGPLHHRSADPQPRGAHKRPGHN